MPPVSDLPRDHIRVTNKLVGWSAAPDGGAYPKRVTIEVTGVPDHPAIPYDMTIEVEVVHGRPVCRSLHVRQCEGGPPVGRAALGGIPVDRIVREAVASTALRPTTDPGRFVPATSDQRAELVASWRPRRGPKGDPDGRQQLVEEVARMYLELDAAGVRHPKPVIAEELGYSTSHIGTLLASARKQGLVGPPPGPGRAGTTGPTRPRA